MWTRNVYIHVEVSCGYTYRKEMSIYIPGSRRAMHVEKRRAYTFRKRRVYACRKEMWIYM